jgi:hypothetical protein
MLYILLSGYETCRSMLEQLIMVTSLHNRVWMDDTWIRGLSITNWTINEIHNVKQWISKWVYRSREERTLAVSYLVMCACGHDTLISNGYMDIAIGLITEIVVYFFISQNWQILSPTYSVNRHRPHFLYWYYTTLSELFNHLSPITIGSFESEKSDEILWATCQIFIIHYVSPHHTPQIFM